MHTIYTPSLKGNKKAKGKENFFVPVTDNFLSHLQAETVCWPRTGNYAGNENLSNQ